jgi:hypothetical protein
VLLRTGEDLNSELWNWGYFCWSFELWTHNANLPVSRVPGAIADLLSTFSRATFHCSHITSKCTTLCMHVVKHDKLVANFCNLLTICSTKQGQVYRVPSNSDTSCRAILFLPSVWTKTWQPPDLRVAAAATCLAVPSWATHPFVLTCAALVIEAEMTPWPWSTDLSKCMNQCKALTDAIWHLLPRTGLVTRVAVDKQWATDATVQISF